jgi:low affinity Fe/Cu permease
LKNVNFDHNHAGEEAIDLAIDESIRALKKKVSENSFTPVEHLYDQAVNELGSCKRIDGTQMERSTQLQSILENYM